MDWWMNGLMKIRISPSPCFPLLHKSNNALIHFSALTIDLVKKNRRRRTDVERIHRRRHRNRHRFVARLQNRRGNPVAFAAENEAAIAGKIRLRQFIFRARMRGDAADAAPAQLLQTFHQRQFHGVRLHR